MVQYASGSTATMHGRRSTFRDWCARRRRHRRGGKVLLMHSLKSVQAAYQRDDLLERRRPVMQAWLIRSCRKISNPSTNKATSAGAYPFSLTFQQDGIITNEKEVMPCGHKVKPNLPDRTQLGNHQIQVQTNDQRKSALKPELKSNQYNASLINQSPSPSGFWEASSDHLQGDIICSTDFT